MLVNAISRVPVCNAGFYEPSANVTSTIFSSALLGLGHHEALTTSMQLVFLREDDWPTFFGYHAVRLMLHQQRVAVIVPGAQQRSSS